jgi:hypothetical protein
MTEAAPPSARPYTGPTGLRLPNESTVHIEGYPDAVRLVKLNTFVGKRLAALRLHQADLGFCQRVTQILDGAFTTPPNDLSNALWICVLTKFYSCFGVSKARFHLDPKSIYAKLPDALITFEYYKHIRDKRIVHDENQHNSPVTAIVLGANDDVQDILHMNFESVALQKEAIENVYNLITAAQTYVDDQIVAALAKAFEEARAMSPVEKAKLENVTYTVLALSDVAKTRTY